MSEDSNNLIKKDRPSIEERRKDIQQFHNVKGVKKAEPGPVWTWIRKMFFSGRSLKDICIEVAEEILVPGIKDNIRNGLVNMIDMRIYEDHKPNGNPTSTPSGSFLTNYVDSYNSKKQTKAELEVNKKKEEETIKNGFRYPAFKTKKEADDFLASMHAYVNKYETMSVQDLAWMKSESVDYTWDKWGWYRNEILSIKSPTHINNPEAPWIINLPKAHEFE